MNIQRKNSAHHFRMQSEREQTLVCNDHFSTLRENQSEEEIMIIIIISSSSSYE